MELVYAIVEFIKSREVAIARITWLNGEEDMCSWPYSNAKESTCVSYLINTVARPKEDWNVFKVRILGKSSIITINNLFLPITNFKIYIF